MGQQLLNGWINFDSEKSSKKQPPLFYLLKSCGRGGCFLELFSESKFIQPFKSYWPHKVFKNFFFCQDLVIILSLDILQKPLMIGFCRKSPPFLFAKKLRKGGLFLRTFFRIKIYPAVQK